jgi:hypothetical protein
MIRFPEFFDTGCITQGIMVILYRRFGTNYRVRLEGLTSPEPFLDFLALEVGTDRLFRNVSIKLTLCAAKYERKAPVSYIAAET